MMLFCDIFSCATQLTARPFGGLLSGNIQIITTANRQILINTGIVLEGIVLWAGVGMGRDVHRQGAWVGN